MYLLNVTCILADSVAGSFIDWLKTDLLNQVTTQHPALNFNLFAIIDAPNEGQTYSLQFTASTIDELNTFKNSNLPILFAKMQQGDLKEKLFLFDTTMQEVQLQ